MHGLKFGILIMNGWKTRSLYGAMAEEGTKKKTRRLTGPESPTKPMGINHTGCKGQLGEATVQISSI